MTPDHRQKRALFLDTKRTQRQYNGRLGTIFSRCKMDVKKFWRNTKITFHWLALRVPLSTVVFTLKPGLCVALPPPLPTAGAGDTYIA